MHFKLKVLAVSASMPLVVAALGGPGVAIEVKQPTGITITPLEGDTSDDYQSVVGQTSLNLNGKRVVVRYFKKKSDGSWDRVGTKRPTVDDQSFGARFAKVGASKCKVTARFAGNSNLAPSGDSWRIDCAKGGD